MSRSTMIGVYAVAIAAIVTIASALFAVTWYHDDACYIEEWQCDIGGLGFAQFILGSISTIIGVVWVFASRLRDWASSDGPPARRPARAELLLGFVAGLVLLAIPWAFQLL